MKYCKHCNLLKDMKGFKKNNQYSGGYTNICKDCIAHKIYLAKNINGFIFKTCKEHGILDYKDIMIEKRKDRGKDQILLRCSICRNNWKQDAILNNQLKNERIELKSKIICKKCKITYDYIYFNQSELKKKSSTCKHCWKKYQERYEDNVSISRKFVFTRKQYNELWEKQKGLCAICNLSETAKENGKIRRLSADHCHKIHKETGKTVVRGLLCTACNNGLGRFKDDPNILKKAAKYLEDFNEKT